MGLVITRDYITFAKGVRVNVRIIMGFIAFIGSLIMI